MILLTEQQIIELEREFEVPLIDVFDDYNEKYIKSLIILNDETLIPRKSKIVFIAYAKFGTGRGVYENLGIKARTAMYTIYKVRDIIENNMNNTEIP